MQLPKVNFYAKTPSYGYCRLFLFLLLLQPFVAFAQNDLKIGQWRSHLPYHVAHSLAQSDTKVYATTKWSIYSIDKESDEVEFLSKVEALSDVEMNLVKYDPFNDKLIAVYNNSNVDLIDDQSVTNLPFIAESQSVGDKRVFDVFVENETTTYFAMGFGMKELNVKNQEFGDETKADIKFNSVVVYNNAVYAATDEGLYRFDRSTSSNIQDFNEWDFLGEAEGFPADYSVNTMAIFEDALYAAIDTVLYRYDGNNLDSVYSIENKYVKYLSAEGERLVVGLGCCVPTVKCDCSSSCTENCNSTVLFMKSDGTYNANGSSCANRSRYAIEDKKGRIWYADSWTKLRRSQSYSASCTDLFEYNSPLYANATQLLVDDNNLWVASTLHSIDPKKGAEGVYSLIDNDWTSYARCQKGALQGLTGFLTLAVHPVNKNMYLGTVDDGIAELVLEVDDSGEEVYKPSVRHNMENSTLERFGNNIRVTGMDFDQDNNLWVANQGAQKPLSVLKNDGTWTNDFQNFPFKNVRYMVVDDLGYKWFAIDGTGLALIVYDDNNTIDDPSDDRYKSFSSSNSEITSNFVFSIAKDLDGDIWVGTTEGIVIFECGGNVFDASCRGSRRILEVDGFNAFLLESEEVTAIAIDGANRKWVGTGNGVFVLSPSGEEQIAFFDKSNSPIFDNQIHGIAINQNNGEVFIGTAKGLLSYRGDANGGGTVNGSSALVYPNPVRPEYDGSIAIKGLARDANIKITDVNGQLIYETTALGGQAIWDGKDYQGRKASSGVYLVFSTNTGNLDSPDAIVGKILFMK